MSASLIEERFLSKRQLFKPMRLHASQTVVTPRKRMEPARRIAIPSVTDDEEMKFIKKYVIWMAVLAVTPLTLFCILTFFYPDILLIPIVPT